MLSWVALSKIVGVVWFRALSANLKMTSWQITDPTSLAQIHTKGESRYPSKDHNQFRGWGFESWDSVKSDFICTRDLDPKTCQHP